MADVVIVTTATAATLDAAAALRASVAAAALDADVLILASSRLAAQGLLDDVVPASQVDPSSYVSSRILCEADEVALCLPALIRRTLSEHRVALFVPPGNLLVSEPAALLAEALERGCALALRSIVTPRYALTPHLARVSDHEWTPEVLLGAFSAGAAALIDEWSAVVGEAVLDIDQLSVGSASQRYLQRLVGAQGVGVEGEHTIGTWSDYAALAVDRAVGEPAPVVDCRSLFDSSRYGERETDPLLAWSRLVHRVHDTRPVQPLLDLIETHRPLFDAAAPETPLDRIKAGIWRAADPFGERWGRGDEERFDDWLFERNEAGCTRFAHICVVADLDLFERFPAVARDPGPFRDWVASGGRRHLGFDPFDPQYPSHEPTPAVAPQSGRALTALQWRWTLVRRLLPGADRRAERSEARRFLGPDPRRRAGVAPPRARPAAHAGSPWPHPEGINLVGAFRSESGLGQAARSTLQALRLLERPFSHIDISDKHPSRNSIDMGLGWETHGVRGDLSILHTNAHETLHLGLLGPLRYRLGGRYNAAMWFWESAVVPDDNRPAFHLVDELWLASTYLADVFGQYARVPTHVVGLPAELPEVEHVDRSRYSWAPTELVFLYVFDALSSYGRKNPGKALGAFVDAFAPDFDDVRFVMKVSNLNKFPDMQAEILGLAEQYPAITVIDSYLTRPEVMHLMAAADVYVSLHAAEGFGLTLLEAMALGTPVICTGYSGNMDFTTAENSWLVDYRMMATAQQHGPYPKGAVWASPDVDHAAALMRQIAADRGSVAEKAAVAVADARITASLEAYASRIDRQIRRIL